MRLDLLHLNLAEDVEKYNAALNLLEDSHPFYKITFLDIFYDGLEKAKAFVLSKDKNIPIVVMPFYLRPIPEIITENNQLFDVISTWGYSGPLYNYTTDESILNTFWNLVDKWYVNNKVVSEFVRFNNHENTRAYTGTLKPTMHIVKGKLLPEEILWKNYNRKVRKNLNKATREKLTTKIFHKNIDLQVMNDFHRIFIHTMDRTHADSRYYNDKEKLYAFVKSHPENSLIILTYLNEIPISSEMILLSSDSMFSFLGGTLSDYFELRPNEILKHHINLWGYKNGFKYFILGGGLGKDDGIFKYKQSFFPNDALPFYTGRKILNHEIYKILCLNSGQDAFSEDFFPMYRKQL